MIFYLSYTILSITHVLKVNLSLKTSKNEIREYDLNKQALRIDIKAPAQDNKANREIIKFFKKLTKKKVTIAKGLKTKEKLLKIE